jgi:hypothetical protein
MMLHVMPSNVIPKRNALGSDTRGMRMAQVVLKPLGLQGHTGETDQPPTSEAPGENLRLKEATNILVQSVDTTDRRQPSPVCSCVQLVGRTAKLLRTSLALGDWHVALDSTDSFH